MGFNSSGQMSFTSERVSRTASFEVHAGIDKAFPLFGPIREKEWAEGWNPEIIYGSPDHIEERFIFRTAVESDEKFYLWTITQFDPQQHLVEYTVSTQNRIWFILVECKPKGDHTTATVTYTYNGLNEKGNELNRHALQKMFADDLRDWQEAINYYLRTGKLLTTSIPHQHESQN